MDQRTGFRDLVAWQKADDLASAVFRACSQISPSGQWLRDQILRCAISVPANIAEGHGRGTQAELLRFIDIAKGSLSELEYYLHFVQKESLLAPEVAKSLDEKRAEAGRVLFGLWRGLKRMDRSDWDHSGRIREDAVVYWAN